MLSRFAVKKKRWWISYAGNLPPDDAGHRHKKIPAHLNRRRSAISRQQPGQRAWQRLQNARQFGVSRPWLPSPTGLGIAVTPAASALFWLAQCPMSTI